LSLWLRFSAPLPTAPPLQLLATLAAMVIHSALLIRA
jgi:hypothetical protein